MLADMITLQSKMDLLCQEYIDSKGPTCSLVYREGVMAGVHLALEYAHETMRTILGTNTTDSVQQKEKREEKE